MYSIIHPIEPFDAAIGTEIKFTWRGNQIYKVRCIVKNNETGVTVYDNTESTMKQTYPLPPNSGLINGTKYIAFITVFDVDNNESTLQNIGTPFYCYTSPAFTLSVSNGDTIRSSSYSMGINYSQIEGELLNWFKITLYSYQKTILNSSGEMYDTSDLSYIVNNLQNATQYYIRATGETIKGISLDTGYILVTVSYTTSQIFSKLELNNIPETGAIEINSHIISAEGVPEKDVIYIDGERVDLSDNSVTFNEGFEIKGDFTAIFKFNRPKRNAVIKEFGTADKLNVKIYYRQGSYSDSNGEKGYFELIANSGGINYISNSGYVSILASDYQYEYSLLVNRKNGLFDLEATAKGTLVRYSPNPDGSNMTESRQPNSQYVGVGYMPKDIYEYENLFKETAKFTTGQNRVNIWYNESNKWTIEPDTETPEYVAHCKDSGLTANSIKSLYPSLIEGVKPTDVFTVDLDFKTPNYAEWSDNDTKGSRPFIIELYGSTSITSRYGWHDMFLGEVKGTTIIPNLPIENNKWYHLTRVIDFNTEQISWSPGKSWADVKYFSIRLTLFKNGELFFRHVKLTRGNKSSNWTPAPSDWISDPNNYEWKQL